MYFKKLELIGFKSFLEKTIFHFDPGITAIVGPNGCGKSNIFDAIRWVLGEQSIKSLRGSEMQDVIFNGTDSKEPLSMAEVSITFDNKSKFFPIEHDELVITRRIFRSGESQYILNKAEVRLKDILDLLMGTGIGAESYSLVAQGKIDLILSSKPEDRRLVFDEASGITRYKAQKKEAMRKLEETEQNLLRVNDIINEVRRQINSLQRQADKARKYKEIFEELKDKEIKLALLNKKILEENKKELLNQLKELESEETRLSEIILKEESSFNNRQEELKELEEKIMELKNQMLNLSNSIVRNKEHIDFNREKIKELDDQQCYLEQQINQLKDRLILDEEKLNSAQKEYQAIQGNIQEKTGILQDKEAELKNLNLSIKETEELISKTKKEILDFVSRITSIKNEITDLLSKEKILLARKRRLEIEKEKTTQERLVIEEELNKLNQELMILENDFKDLNEKISTLKTQKESESKYLDEINLKIQECEKQISALISQRDFLKRLKSEYEGIEEALNAVVYLDRCPEDLTGLVIKIKESEGIKKEEAGFRLIGEAKPVDLDTERIEERLNRLQEELSCLKTNQQTKQAHLKQIDIDINRIEDSLHNQEMNLVNKKTSYQVLLEDFNKIKQEEDLIDLELAEVDFELKTLNEKKDNLLLNLNSLEEKERQAEQLINQKQESINLNIRLKEELLIIITQTKTELDALQKRIDSDWVTLKIFQDTISQQQENLKNLEEQVQDNNIKRSSLVKEIKEWEEKINQEKEELQKIDNLLKEKQKNYQVLWDGSADVIKGMEIRRKHLDDLRNRIHQLKMQYKEIDFKSQSIKDRILQAYNIELDTVLDYPEGLYESDLSKDIQVLKQKLDSLGTVNLVAIEEYDELKKRYDFLNQQQNDLVSAKKSLQDVINKINRTTRKMFLETFEQIKVEFRNYFRLLFNGGDVQLFLIDEEDPLESGIEIICRPPGKKLQNVLLLSGGEKALSAIALLFAIFKVKPSPFCVLDEIDAALDEANIDRFGRILQEFAKTSQFIVITHNKRTIANADVMYGITMEESGVSKVVSVKFAQEKPKIDKEPDIALSPTTKV
ncbi:MAG: AAA family ATPase [Candidatus Omnitrophica bacterium]|nr:AAA family ATPase [Candidatus Omnitrophota bacterium]